MKMLKAVNNRHQTGAHITQSWNQKLPKNKVIYVVGANSNQIYFLSANNKTRRGSPVLADPPDAKLTDFRFTALHRRKF